MKIKVAYTIYSDEIYKPVDGSKEVLVEGDYGDRHFVILRNGHIGTACAYIEARKTDAAWENCAEVDEGDPMDYYYGYVHGGYTYAGHAHWSEPGKDDREYIGWDYAHYGDYAAYAPLNTGDFEPKKWTIHEILEEVHSAYIGIMKQNAEGAGVINE